MIIDWNLILSVFVSKNIAIFEISERCAIGRSKLETAIIISISPLRVKFSCLLIQAAWVKWQLDFKVAPLNNNCLWKKKFPNNRNNGRTHCDKFIKNVCLELGYGETVFFFWKIPGYPQPTLIEIVSKSKAIFLKKNFTLGK